MIKILILTLVVLNIAFSQLKVVASYPWIGYLVGQIGGDRVKVYTLVKPSEDPHFVVPKPSYIAIARSADLLLVNGAGLEVGFIPPILQQSNNSKIQPGRMGYLDLSQYIDLIEKPQRVSRELGDVHPEGNPHYHLDPHNIPILAKAIKERLCQIDKQGCNQYRQNLDTFIFFWSEKLKTWDERMKKHKGKRVISYHALYNYFLKRYGIELVATIEPLPGISPNAKHVENLINRIKEGDIFAILQDVYHEKATAQYIASKTGVKVIVLPHDVGTFPEIKSLPDLFDYMTKAFQ